MSSDNTVSQSHFAFQVHHYVIFHVRMVVSVSGETYVDVPLGSPVEAVKMVILSHCLTMALSLFFLLNIFNFPELKRRWNF